MYFFATETTRRRVRLREALLRLEAVVLDGVEVVPQAVFEGGDLFDEPVCRGHELIFAPGLLPHLGDEVGRENVRHDRDGDDAEVGHLLVMAQPLHRIGAERQLHGAIDESPELLVREDLGVAAASQFRPLGVTPLRRLRRPIALVVLGRCLTRDDPFVTVDEGECSLVDGLEARELLEQGDCDAGRGGGMAVGLDVGFFDLAQMDTSSPSAGRGASRRRP